MGASPAGRRARGSQSLQKGLKYHFMKRPADLPSYLEISFIAVLFEIQTPSQQGMPGKRTSLAPKKYKFSKTPISKMNNEKYSRGCITGLWPLLLLVVKLQWMQTVCRVISCEWFLPGKTSPPRDISDVLTRPYGWRLEGRGQGCRLTSYRAQGSSP